MLSATTIWHEASSRLQIAALCLAKMVVTAICEKDCNAAVLSCCSIYEWSNVSAVVAVKV
jgi:hypothetical protein